MNRLSAVEHEINAHLAAEERAEDAREALESRFADLSDYQRAELLMTFLEAHTRELKVMPQYRFGVSPLSEDFWAWVKERREMQ